MSAKVRLGLEIFVKRCKVYKAKRIAIVTNATGVDSRLRQNVDIMLMSGLRIVRLFTPEHGFEGAIPDGASVADSSYRGIPVYSLFGPRTRPTSDMLEDIDIVIYDVQDVGLRFYTYVTTLAYCIEECGKKGVEIIILDRPNPLSWKVEGPVIKKECESIVGGYGLPVRYGLTVGELALYLNEQFKMGARITIFPMEGYNPRFYYDETGLLWNIPSPNLPSLEHVILYSGLCLLEGVNVSVGRGTVNPFKYVGAPWVRSETLYEELVKLRPPGVSFRKRSFIPCASKFKGELCQGLEFFVTHRERIRPLELAIDVISILKRTHPEEFVWDQYCHTTNDRPYFDYLIGDSFYREAINQGATSKDLAAHWEKEAKDFARYVNKFRIYK